jgi:hypothetical protein
VTEPWLRIALVISCVTLVLQLVAKAWWPVVSYLDPRDWSWRSYATACAVSIVVLMATRAWQNNSS